MAGGDMADRRIERSIVLPAPPDVVWEALLDEEQLARWFGDLQLEPHFGGAVDFTDDDGRRRRGVVQTVEPGRRLAFRWWGDDDGSRVELVVDDEDDGSRLTVIETALDSAQPDDGAARALAMAR